jgi:hypothetical protein
MLNNKFKYWEGQILCIRLNYRTGYCTHESVPLCHDLLRLSLCSADLFFILIIIQSMGWISDSNIGKKKKKIFFFFFFPFFFFFFPKSRARSEILLLEQ